MMFWRSCPPMTSMCHPNYMFYSFWVDVRKTTKRNAVIFSLDEVVFLYEVWYNFEFRLFNFRWIWVVFEGVTRLKVPLGTQGGARVDDGKHSEEWLELRWESVSFLNRGVWGDWAGKLIHWWDFYRFGVFLVRYFLEENRVCRCVGSKIVFSLFFNGFFGFSGGSEPRSARAGAVQTQFFIFEAASKQTQCFLNFYIHFKVISGIDGFQMR